ncbi:MAG: DUF1801 domain-containing protein [Chitinophagaceae bacterium]|nr:DUF1801 domain-containing protein [Chitinophagaceae bacterium]
MKKEIEKIRKIVLNANTGLTEHIKWNAPSFCFLGDDRITMRIYPIKNIQLIFHRGAKVKQQPKNKLISDDSGLLLWKENDRAVMTLTNMEDIKSKEPHLIEIVNKWLKATATSLSSD